VNQTYKPVLIAWVNRSETDMFRDGNGENISGNVLAMGGPSGVLGVDGNYRSVTGAVAVDVVSTTGYLAPGSGTQSFAVMLMHELGHVMGLDHAVNDNQQLMYPAIGPNYKDFGAGDRTGLALKGRTGACSPATAEGDATASRQQLPPPGPISLVPEADPQR
jgi:hypothetical protein